MYTDARLGNAIGKHKTSVDEEEEEEGNVEQDPKKITVVTWGRDP